MKMGTAFLVLGVVLGLISVAIPILKLWRSMWAADKESYRENISSVR